jgi:hypothetical protein
VQRFFELAVEHERERVKLARDEERQQDGLAGLRAGWPSPRRLFIEIAVSDRATLRGLTQFFAMHYFGCP